MALKRGTRGFTLLELLMSLGLATLLVSWAIPAMSDWWRGTQLASASNRLMGLLESTRYESLALQHPVTVCASQDSQRCSRDGGRYLMVFQDGNGNGVLDAGEVASTREELLGGDEFHLAWRAFQNRPYLRWAAGRTDSMNGTFTLCNQQRRDEWLRQIVVNRTGRARVVVPASASGSVLQSARRSCGW